MNAFRSRSRKSSVDEIRARFDQDVERFSDLQLGQQATIDAALAMDLVADAAAMTTPQAIHLLDVGCGAGNYTLKLLERLPALNVTLLDLSQPMLHRARSRTIEAGAREVETVQADVRDVDLGAERFDIVLAAAVLHHLRSEGEWAAVFEALHTALRPGGSLWVFDLVTHESPAVQDVM